MKRVFQLLFVGVAVLSWAGQAQASVLVGVTGDGAIDSESLYFLSQTDASSTFIMRLGNGRDGETIGFNPVDGLLYHASGISPGDRFWESINVGTTTIVTSGQFTGPAVVNENLAMTYNSATGTFLVANRDQNVFYDATLAGVATDIGTTPEDLKGLAFIGSTLYGASAFSDTLYELDPTDGSVVSSLAVTLDGGSIRGMNGLATDPDTGLLWGIFRLSSGGRLLGTLDPTTGTGTSVGILSDNFAGIAFLGSTAAVPEPSTFALLGIGAIGMAFGAVRNLRTTKNTVS